MKRFRFGLRSIFIATTLSAVASLMLVTYWPSIVQLWRGVEPARYVPEVEARYVEFRTAVLKGDFAKADAILSPAYRSELQATKMERPYRFIVPEAIRSKYDVFGRGDIALVVFKAKHGEEGEGDFYRWQKIDGEWYISSIESIYFIS